MQRCPACQSDRIVLEDVGVRCAQCDAQLDECPTCAGNGFQIVGGFDCQICRGDGVVLRKDAVHA